MAVEIVDLLPFKIVIVHSHVGLPESMCFLPEVTFDKITIYLWEFCKIFGEISSGGETHDTSGASDMCCLPKVWIRKQQTIIYTKITKSLKTKGFHNLAALTFCVSSTVQLPHHLQSCWGSFEPLWWRHPPPEPRFRLSSSIQRCHCMDLGFLCHHNFRDWSERL